MIEEASNRKYKVQFDDGVIHVVASNILRIEQASASLPPSERPPLLPPISHHRGDGQEDAHVAELADEESVEDELGDPNREQAGEESEEEEGQGAENTQGETSGVFVGEDLPKNYHKRLPEAREKIKGLLGKTVIKDSFLWTVIEEHHSDDLSDTNAQFLGVKGIELHRLVKNNIFSTLFLHLMF